MKRMMCALVSLIVATLVAGPAIAQDVVIYPARAEQRADGEGQFECYGWAKARPASILWRRPRQRRRPTQAGPEQHGRRCR